MAATFVLSDLTQDFDQFVNQFQNSLTTKSAWEGNLTTQTSTTMVELASAIGTLHQGRIIRASEDAYAETAQSDDAILSIAQMQGIRLTRYLPAGMPVLMTSPYTITLPPMTQFSCGGYSFFNRVALELTANVSQQYTLYEGTLIAHVIQGLGTDNQFYICPEDSFTVSDQDTAVYQNGVTLPKSFGNLWNYDGLPAYADMTTFDGRLMVMFGSSGGTSGTFGTIPGVNDTMSIVYAQTKGMDANGAQLSGQTLTTVGYPTVQGIVQSNPSGGASTKSIVAYKNVASGAFGTYSSAVTKNQYTALVATFPGIVDAVTQAQREIDPGDLRWMNVIRVSALTTSPWTQDQIQEFIDYCQKQSMYAVYFLWQDAIPVPRVVDIDVFIYNSADPSTVKLNSTTAITNLFAPRPGILMTDFYEYDLQEAIANANPGLISYVKVNHPTTDMTVTAPESPPITYTLLPGGGTLGEFVYSYSIAITTQFTDDDGNVWTEVGLPQNWVFPQVISPTNSYGIELTWPAVPNAISYTVYGRRVTADGSQLGVLGTVLPTSPLTFTDNGSITPTGGIPTSMDFPIKYNSLESLTINVQYSNRQQRQLGEDPTRLLGG